MFNRSENFADDEWHGREQVRRRLLDERSGHLLRRAKRAGQIQMGVDDGGGGVTGGCQGLAGGVN